MCIQLYNPNAGEAIDMVDDLFFMNSQNIPMRHCIALVHLSIGCTRMHRAFPKRNAQRVCQLRLPEIRLSPEALRNAVRCSR
jgi:hypothetical protein